VTLLGVLNLFLLDRYTKSITKIFSAPKTIVSISSFVVIEHKICTSIRKNFVFVVIGSLVRKFITPFGVKTYLNGFFKSRYNTFHVNGLSMTSCPTWLVHLVFSKPANINLKGILINGRGLDSDSINISSIFFTLT